MTFKKNSISIIGAFGYEKNSVNGQSIKTQLLKQRLSVLSKKKIKYCDTLSWKKHPFKTIINLLNCFMNSSVVFILPGINGLRMLLVYNILKFFFRTDLRYLVVGGWLPDYLKKNIINVRLLKNIDHIYVQSSEMKKILISEGLDNIIVMPNSKFFDLRRLPEFPISQVERQLRLVFFSRVTPEKGIEDAIRAVAELNNEGHSEIIFDIYGPIEKGYEFHFFDLLRGHFESINYRGVIKPVDEDIYKILSKYDFLVFPTYYFGEGFPGVVIDSYIAGLPVLASNWKYNSEYVHDGKTGFIFDVHNVKALKKLILKLSVNREEYLYMRSLCLQEAQKYHSDKIIQEFFGDIL